MLLSDQLCIDNYLYIRAGRSANTNLTAEAGIFGWWREVK